MLTQQNHAQTSMLPKNMRIFNFLFIIIVLCSCSSSRTIQGQSVSSASIFDTLRHSERIIIKDTIFQRDTILKHRVTEIIKTTHNERTIKKLDSLQSTSDPINENSDLPKGSTDFRHNIIYYIHYIIIILLIIAIWKKSK